MTIKCVVLMGVPGSGKSTFASGLISRVGNCQIYSADDFFMKDGEYKFDARQLGEAHSSCLRRFNWSVRLMVNGRTLIVDNTNTTLPELAPYVAFALAYGWDTSVVVCNCDPETAFKRNIHGVPLRSIQRMSDQICETLSNWPKFWPQPTIIDTNDANGQ